jgi:hypothetical protein
MLDSRTDRFFTLEMDTLKHKAELGNSEKDVLLNALQAIFPDAITEIREPWAQSDWSHMYEVHTRYTDFPLMLKGTPRNRPEAKVTARLHQYCPDLVPNVLAEDLLPRSSWRWFLLDHAGDAPDPLAPYTAVQAAFALGILQRMVCRDSDLPTWLPDCGALHLQRAAVQVCDWALAHSEAGEAAAQLQDLRASIVRATTFFDQTAQHLTTVPMTCVHGDLWAGNITISQNLLRFIDWGDAIWGTGGSALVHLIETADGAFSAWTTEIWDGYSAGWQREISPEYIETSAIAHLVIELVVDMEIAKCCGRGPEMLPGLLNGMQRLVAAIE